MLARVALRMAAVEALKGQTLVEDQVLDSQIGALARTPEGSIEADQETRFIAVYTQEGETTGLDAGPRALYGTASCDLVFETGITSAMMVRDAETGDKDVLEGVPATDSAFEFYLDLLNRQIVDVLVSGEGVWSEIWRELAVQVTGAKRQRTDSAAQVRLAGHQLTLNCVLAADPVLGEPLAADYGFGRFLAALEDSADPGHQARAALMRQALTGSDVPDLTVAQRRLGLTQGEMNALGLVPDVVNADGTTPEFETADIEVEGSGSVTVSGDGA